MLRIYLYLCVCVCAGSLYGWPCEKQIEFSTFFSLKNRFKSVATVALECKVDKLTLDKTIQQIRKQNGISNNTTLQNTSSPIVTSPPHYPPPTVSQMKSHINVELIDYDSFGGEKCFSPTSKGWI